MSAKPPSLVPPLGGGVVAPVVVGVLVDEEWPPDGLGPTEPLLQQIPDPTALPRGTWVAVTAAGPQPERGLARLLRRPSRGAHLAVRCTALLLRGYANTCADAEGTAFGQVP